MRFFFSPFTSSHKNICRRKTKRKCSTCAPFFQLIIAIIKSKLNGKENEFSCEEKVAKQTSCYQPIDDKKLKPISFSGWKSQSVSELPLPETSSPSFIPNHSIWIVVIFVHFSTPLIFEIIERIFVQFVSGSSIHGSLTSYAFYA